MFAMPAFDVAGPGVVLFMVGAGLGGLCILTLVITLLEAIVLLLLKWGTFGRSLVAALVMNLVTTMIGFGMLVFMKGDAVYLALVLDFILSVLIEGGVLMLFRRGAARANWVAALSANAASYLIIILPIFIFGLP
jgi:hypothetical protein